MKNIEIKLNGWQAGAIMAAVVTEAVLGFVALHKRRKETKRAIEAEVKSWCSSMEIAIQDMKIKNLEKKIEELKNENKS